MLGLPNVGSHEFFSFKTSPQSVFDVLYMAQWKNRTKNKIRCSKIYLKNLLLSKARKCSNVVNPMKIKREKSNDQIQVKL